MMDAAGSISPLCAAAAYFSAVGYAMDMTASADGRMAVDVVVRRVQSVSPAIAAAAHQHGGFAFVMNRALDIDVGDHCSASQR
jgi:hypothetical protein